MKQASRSDPVGLRSRPAAITTGPVDRVKGGLKRSQVCGGAGIPLAAVPAPANRRDHPPLAVSLDALAAWEPLPEHVTVHLDAGHDYKPCRAELAERGLDWSISQRGRRCRSASDGWWRPPTPG